MRHFVCNELEPLAYLVYALVLYLLYKRTAQARHRVLFLFYTCGAILLLTGIQVTSIMNNWSYNILFLAGICVFSWYFYSLFYSHIKKAIVIFCAAVNILLLVYFDITMNIVDSFNGYAYGVSFITIVLYTLFYFHQLLDRVTEENLLLNVDFWLVCGYLFYFLGSFFIIIYYEHMDVLKRAEIWGIQNCILFFCSLIMLGMYIFSTKREKVLDE